MTGAIVTDAIVIGAGIGGLCAAIRLAAAGWSVEVIEAAGGPGGKAGVAEVDGARFDTGPSLLTLPGLFDEVLEPAGTCLRDEVTLRAPAPMFRYRFPDGRVVDLHHALEASEASVREALGPAAAGEFRAFLEYAREIWEAAGPNFVMGPAPSARQLARLGLPTLGAVTRIDPLRSMRGAIHARVRDPWLRLIFERFATYNGSDVRAAPATLNCIAWVELGLGGWAVEGGIYALVEALARVATRLGVRWRWRSPVEQVLLERGRVVGVRCADGERRARAVVANADVAHLAADLLPGHRHGLPADRPPSMSGWNAVLRARRDPSRAAHEVLFPADYTAEFVDIFDRSSPPRRPTVYLCAQGVAHGLPGWADAEPLFLMANAPAEPARGPSDAQTWEALRERVLTRLRDLGRIAPDDAVVWERSPAGLAARFPGSRGAIYGAASNSRFAAFQRPDNRVHRIPGLYLASGSAHPGGGLPLCAVSGRMAAGCALEDAGVRDRIAT